MSNNKANLKLALTDVHLWIVGKCQPDWEMLSRSEQDRAESFANPEKRKRFVCVRNALRRLIGSYLYLDPISVPIVEGARGKPKLANEATFKLWFNLSHSPNYSVVAVTQISPVGVDIECITTAKDIARLEKRILSLREQVDLANHSPQARKRALLQAWTAKEAYLKATGQGINRPLAEIEIALAPGTPLRLRKVAGDPAAPNRWQLYEIHPVRNVIGALMVAGSAQVRLRYYPPSIVA